MQGQGRVIRAGARRTCLRDVPHRGVRARGAALRARKRRMNGAASGSGDEAKIANEILRKRRVAYRDHEAQFLGAVDRRRALRSLVLKHRAL